MIDTFFISHVSPKINIPSIIKLHCDSLLKLVIFLILEFFIMYSKSKKTFKTGDIPKSLLLLLSPIIDLMFIFS